MDEKDLGRDGKKLPVPSRLKISPVRPVQILREKQTAGSLNCFRFFVLDLVSRPLSVSAQEFFPSYKRFITTLTLISIAKTLHSKYEQKLLMTSRLDHKSTGDNSKFYIKDSIIKDLNSTIKIYALLYAPKGNGIA